MPTYVYRCPRGHEFERFQKITDPPAAACPTCGERAERVITGGGGLLFKGSGFYATDYRTPTYKEAEKKEKGDAGSTSKPSSGSAKTEAKEGKS